MIPRRRSYPLIGAIVLAVFLAGFASWGLSQRANDLCELTADTRASARVGHVKAALTLSYQVRDGAVEDGATDGQLRAIDDSIALYIEAARQDALRAYPAPSC